jgi:hypothetical protein
MLRDKGTKIISELKNYFSSDRRVKANFLMICMP